MGAKGNVKKQLMDSFKKIALREPVEKITIREITDEAGVIRPTFYHHFQDKYEVIECIISEEILQPAKPLLENDMLREAIVLIFTNLQKDKEFYGRISRMEGQNSFDAIVRHSIRELLSEFVVERMGAKKAKHVWLTPERIVDYYTQSMSFVVLEWIDSEMPIEPSEIGEIYHYIMTRSMADILRELETV